MKKTIKIISFILVLLVVCASLSGCAQLDEMRKNQGFYNDVGNIILNGKEYVLLENTEFLLPLYNNQREIYITEKDVPVLLSNTFGEYFSISDDGVFLENFATSNIYCLKENHEQISTALNNKFTPSGFIISYTDYSSFNPKDKRYRTSNEESEEIKKVLSSKPTSLTEEEWYNTEYVSTIYSCSKENFILREEADIMKQGDEFYISFYSEGAEEASFYKATPMLKKLFAGFVIEE